MVIIIKHAFYVSYVDPCFIKKYDFINNKYLHDNLKINKEHNVGVQQHPGTI